MRSNSLESKKTVFDAAVIVEIGGNHEGDVAYAYKLVDSAIAVGAKNIKLQSYTGPSLVNHQVAPERAKHFERFALPYDDQVKIAKYVLGKGASFMSSLWDKESFEVLDPYIDIHKVGSGDLTNFQMIRRFCETNKPLILSTAMSDIALIRKTVDFIRHHYPFYTDPNQLALLQCVAMYGDLEDRYANLNAISDLRAEFPDLVVGYSDHTLGVVASIMAIGKGAGVIEVHFTDDKNREFRDHHLSVVGEELRLLIEASDRATNLNGVGLKNIVHDVETPHRIREFRRACYLNSDVTPGQIIQAQDIICLRPNIGIDASESLKLEGHVARTHIAALSPLEWEMFE